MSRNTVRGTPYTHVKASNTEGQKAGKPGGYEGTVGRQYGDDEIQTGPGRGTPYQSRGGNGPETRRVVSSDKYGKVETNAAGNMNDPATNGSGVILDGADSYSRGFSPGGEATLDSPIPRDAPRFDPGFISAEDEAHLGSGNRSGTEGLLAGGGVMSRGMVGTSKSSGSETELTEDDTLPSTGPAGKA